MRRRDTLLVRVVDLIFLKIWLESDVGECPKCAVYYLVVLYFSGFRLRVTSLSSDRHSLQVFATLMIMIE